ncbi:hypothetical protein LCGC14_0799600 [marine sediment metagenome]|uniref:Uncharacterized protein n=1 Tax=marine sediment metagenome TaxID=412755 RepID=A0A0F9SX84_9ZZZZ
MKILEIASASVIGAALGAGITFMLVNDRLTALEKANDYRAPVALVDFTSIAEAFPEGGDDTEINLQIRKLQIQSRQLVEQGFIVLNQDAVYAAPPGVTIRYKEKEGE